MCLKVTRDKNPSKIEQHGPNSLLTQKRNTVESMTLNFHTKQLLMLAQ